MIKVDASLLWQMANFIILILALNYVLFKPIRRVLLQRKQKIKDLGDSAGAAATGAKERAEALAAGIKEARERGLQKKEELLQAAAGEEKALIEKINKKAAQDLAAAKKKIESEIDDVRAALKKEIGGFAKAIGEKILGRAV